MMNYLQHQWNEEQFLARVQQLSRNGYINRLDLRRLMDSQLASPAIRSVIRDSLNNHLSKQRLHVKYDLGIGRHSDSSSAQWSSTEFFAQLAALVDKEHYVKNDSQRWTIETISRKSIKELMIDLRMPECYQRGLSTFLDQHPNRKIFKLENIENFLRQNVVQPK